MPSNQAILAINRLLAALAFKDRKQLFTNCEPIELIFSEVLCRAHSARLLPNRKRHSLDDAHHWRRRFRSEADR